MSINCTGPIVWAPLSEQFGRRWLVVGTFVMFCTWTLACALAPNWPAFLIFRLLVGVFASAPIALVAGIMADIYGEYRTRGRAMASFFAVSSSFFSDPTTASLPSRPSLTTATTTIRPQFSARSSPPSYPASAPRPSAGGGPSGSASSTRASP